MNTDLTRTESARLSETVLSENEARRPTDEVKADAQALWSKCLRLYEGHAHEALGYSSWGAYWQAEFNESGRRGYQLLDAARVTEALNNCSLPPANEAQARELVPFLRDEGEQQVVAVWRELRAEYGDDVTAEKVRAVVARKLKCDRLKPAPMPVPETPSLPTDRYRCLVADPPWFLPPTGPRTGNGWPGLDGWQSSLPYPTMSLEEIKALPIGDLAESDAHLYLWTINRYIEDAYGVARAWGFEPSTLITWSKAPRGLGLGGAWVLTTEHVLFCRRGTLKTTRRIDRTCFPWPRRGHSVKPAEFLELVETVSPGPYLELFARENRAGWAAWGNEAPEAVAA